MGRRRPRIVIVLVHSLHLYAYIQLEWSSTSTFTLRNVKTRPGNALEEKCLFLVYAAAYLHERNVKICHSAHFAVFGCVVWNHLRVIKTSYFWAHARKREHYKALCISLNCVFSNANKQDNKCKCGWRKSVAVDAHTCSPALCWAAAFSPVWLCCHVLFHPVLLYALFLVVLKVRSFQLYEGVCVCVCVSVGPRNEAHCHSIQWPNAKGSRV